MLRRLLGEHVQLDTRCAPDLPAIHADACNLEQVIMNLAVNSRDAMPHGGQLTIRAEPVRIGPAYVAAHPEAAAGDFVCLSVSDTGCGMDAATQARLFEPFFTTKEVGKGTGMGLASVYGIVKQHNGWIEVNSTVGQGSEFKVFLPVCSTEAVEPPRAALSHTSRILRPQHETILVVEDEPFLREFIETVLRNCGYRILVAGDANEALRVWDEQRGRIDLLLTDMVMPGGMSGHQLVKELSRRTPDLKAIYTSGYSRDVLGSELKWDDERVFLQKPYQSQVLVRTVRECLAETSRPRGMVNSGWAALN
jgi:CheY-like chemotaxis protein